MSEHPKNNAAAKVSTPVGTQNSGNWIVKLLCVFAAFLLWLYVMVVVSPEYQETFYEIPITLTGIEDLKKDHGLSIYNSEEAGTVNVTVAGKRSIVLKLEEDQIVATADVSGISSPGKTNVTIDVELPSGVTLVEKSQNKVQLVTEESVSRVIPINEKVINLDLPASYELGSVKYSFDTIQVSGPKSIVDSIAAARVNIDFEGRTTSFDATCDIYFINAFGDRVTSPYIQYDETQVDVYVPVYRSLTVPVEVSFVYGYLNESNATITVTPSEVTVKGEEAAMRADTLISPILLDEKKITENSYGRTITLQPAEGVMIEDDITNVQVQVDVDPSIQYMVLSVTDIEVTGADGIQYAVMDDELQVTLRGPLEALAKIRPADVYALVDLSGYSADNIGIVTKTPTIVIDVEDASEICEVGEYSVQVQIN